MALAAVALAGCGGDGGGSGGGGSGGTTGSGGTDTTTTTGSLEACPVNAEAHVSFTIVRPDGEVAGYEAVDVSGSVVGAGVDSPPSDKCGAGEAWVQINANGPDWIVCMRAPNLQINQAPGDTATLTRSFVDHFVAGATLHDTLSTAGTLALHVEWALKEEDLALPDGITIAKGDATCSSPEDACQHEGFSVVASDGTNSVTIPPGESGDLGTTRRLYVDHYYELAINSGCDSAGADILIAVAPPPL